MNKKGILVIICTSIMLLGAIYFNSKPPITNINEDKTPSSIYSDNLRQAAIPNDFYQEINLGENYIYNVTGFGLDAKWTNYTGSPDVNWKTDPGEQILVNFTGFYNRDPSVPVDSFPDTDMPWMNISIFEDKSGPSLNYTNANVSNSEVARNLKLGFSGFQSGFLIKVNHTDWLTANATLEANGASGPKADLTIEETYNFLYLRFEQSGIINNKTELIYDRVTGLLVWANITVDNYHIELFWEGYVLDFEKIYVYDIQTFGPPGYAFWHDLAWPSTYKDTWALRTGSWIHVNFTGYYHEDPLDQWDFDDFTDQEKRVWLDIKAIYNGDSGPITTMSLNNISNQEAVNSMTLGVGNLVPGFLLITINNDSFDLSGSLSSNGALFNGKTSIKETDLTIKITFEHNPGAFLQDTYLIYEKRTGLLLWADTRSGGNYHLIMTIEDYTPWTESTSRPYSEDDDDDDDKKKKQQAIPSFPLLILIGVVFTMSLILIFKTKGFLNKNPKL